MVEGKPVRTRRKQENEMSNSKEIAKWSDDFMFTAEESNAADGVKAFLLGAPTDPLGHVAACAKMYKGEVVRDLRDVTDEERREYLEQVQKTILGMPLEAVQLHFMIEGVTRSLTHQAVRQRTAAYAQESMRFAVKEDMASSVAYPPSLEGTLSLDELARHDLIKRELSGLKNNTAVAEWREDHKEGVRRDALSKGGPQAHRIRWDEGVGSISQVYLDLINDGMPAEDARGLAVHNTTTRYNYITNLRNFYTEMSKRLSDQAQFEWRMVAMNLALAMRRFGEVTSYEVWVDQGDVTESDDLVAMTEDRALVRRSSYWQYEALSNEMKPADFIAGRRTFAANFDRPSRIGERVDAFASKGIPSSEWTTGSTKHSIPPIFPDEWLLDPNSARLTAGQEFDVFGNRVPKGEGWHWTNDENGQLIRQRKDGSFEHRRWPEDFTVRDNGTTSATKDA